MKKRKKKKKMMMMMIYIRNRQISINSLSYIPHSRIKNLRLTSLEISEIFRLIFSPFPLKSISKFEQQILRLV